MKTYKQFNHILGIMTLSLLLSIDASIAQGVLEGLGVRGSLDGLGTSQSGSYLSAAKAYRNAASQTNCASRRSYFIKHAECLETNARQLQSGGTLSRCEFGAEPACPADAGNNPGSSGSNTGTNSNDPVAAVLERQAQTNSAIDAGFNALQNHMDNGGKASGGILRGSLMAASQVASPKASLGVMGVGAGLSLIAKAAEANKERKEAERLEQERVAEAERQIELVAQRERERLRLAELKRQEAINTRRFVILDQRSKVLPPDVTESIPSHNADQNVQVLYYLPFAVNREHRDAFAPYPIWLGFASVTIHRNPDGTWPFLQSVKDQIIHTSNRQQPNEIDLQLLGPFISPDRLMAVRDDIENRTKNSDALLLMRFQYDALTIKSQSKTSTNFWDNSQSATGTKDTFKKSNSSTSFWDN